MPTKNPALPALAEQVEAKIQELRPEYINPLWIRKHLNSRFCKKITQCLKKMPGHPERKDWHPFLECLSPASRLIWKEETHARLGFNECIQNVLKVLRKNKPTSFGPRYLEIHCRYEYQRIREIYCKREKGRIRWHLFTAKLPKTWAKRWKTRKRYTVKELVTMTAMVVKKEDPAQFGPAFLRYACGSIYWQITRSISWDTYQNMLPKNLQQRFCIMPTHAQA